MIDSSKRAEIAQAIAKAIAYKNCGEHHKAADCAIKVIELMECNEILAYYSDPKRKI